MASDMDIAHSTTLLDLPDELIDQILAEVKWGAPTAPSVLDTLQFYETLTQNTASIQLVRLTCRRLASRASGVLLPVASVSISDPSSIDRLEQIANHPAFAPCVKAVHVCFDFYEAELAADPRALAAYLLHLWHGLALLTGVGGPLWARIINDWKAVCNGEKAIQQRDSKGDNQEGVQLLSRLHLEYKRRYEAQQRLGPSVVQRIANAMALMPRATRLVLDDGPATLRVGNIHAILTPSTQEELEWLIPPTRWATAFKLGRGSPPIETLFSLPTAVHNAGVKLTGLRIHRLQLPYMLPLWRPAANQHWEWTDPPLPETVELRSACRWLRVFEFTPGYPSERWPVAAAVPTDTPSEWPGDRDSHLWPHKMGLYEVLDHILTASRELTHVRVDLHKIHAGVSYHLSSKHPGSWPWPRIRVFHLENGDLETTTVPRFLRATAGTLAELHLSDMWLCSRARGFSWASLLDQLRAHNGATGGRPTTIRLRRPRGAEFVWLDLSDDDRAHLDSLFDHVGGDDDGLSAVDRFIQGLGDCNPVVEACATRGLKKSVVWA